MNNFLLLLAKKTKKSDKSTHSKQLGRSYAKYKTGVV